MGVLRFLFTQYEDDYRRTTRLISRAARSKGVSEYELFQLAHRAWYRSEAEQSRLEKIFVAYLFSGRVPVWVQDFAQRSDVDSDSDQCPGAALWCLEFLLLKAGHVPWPGQQRRRRTDRLLA